MKRNLIIILVVLVAVAAAIVYFTKDEVTFSKETSLYKAVPVTSPAFVELSSLRAIPLKNPVVEELAQLEGFDRVLDMVVKTDTLLKSNKDIQRHLGKKPLVVAFDFVGENIIRPVVIGKVQSSSEQKALDRLMQNYFPQPGYSFAERKYSGHTIVDINSHNSDQNLHYCVAGGLAIISPEAILVEKSLRQLNTQSITGNSSFTRVNKTVTPQSDISWYINHTHFPGLLSNWANGKSHTVVNEFGENVRWNNRNLVRGLREYASWSELDLKVDENKIALNGITVADDSLNQFLTVFAGQQPVTCRADRMLPRNTSYFFSWSVSDKDLFFDRLEEYFVHADSYYKREEQIKKIERNFRADLKNTLRSMVKNNMVAALTSVSGRPDQNTSFFIFNTDEKVDARAQFEALLNSYADRQGVDRGSMATTFAVDDETTFRIYRFPYPSLPGIWLGKSFGFVRARFATFYDNNLVFCSSEKALHEYLHSMVLNSTLGKSVGYQKFEQSLESRANISVYANVTRLYALNSRLFDSDISKSFEKHEELFRKFDALSWQMVCEKDLFFNSINLSYDDNPETDAQTLWQSNIGTAISMKPQLVVNHNDRGKKEIIVQDDSNTLHLVTGEGRIRWSIPVAGPILGKIHQVDYYRNGKLQYLFNTKEKLYLIDRNGNKVAGFPVTFRSPATNGVNVFDYDNNRKYRYFVACEDRKVYAYDHEGKIITGWKFGQTAGTVSTPVQHFRVNNRDYIVFKDKNNIYIQNRRGETRVQTPVKFENSKNPLVLNLDGTPKIVATDITGKVYYLYFNGKYAEKKTGKFGADHFFTVSDINANGVPDFVFVDGKELTVMDENGKKLFSEKFKNPIPIRPNLYSFAGGQKKIGVTDAEANRIYLFDAKGKLHEGFPLAGNTEFSIGALNGSQLNLVVGSRGGDLYNYGLE